MAEEQQPSLADTKAKEEGGGEHINLKVKSQDGAEVHFKIKKSTQLRKLMEAYCQRQGVQRQQMRFLFDGQALTDTATPIELGMEEGDAIDAMVMQTGGMHF